MRYLQEACMAHEKGSQVAGNVPTPGEPNQYVRKPQ